MKLTAGEAGKRKAMGTKNKLDGTQRDGKDEGQWEGRDGGGSKNRKVEQGSPQLL